MKTSLITLAATLLCATSFSSASVREVKYSAVNVNDNWYYCGQEMSWCKGGAFNQANLGVITSLELGGQSQVNTGNDWGGGTMTMGYSIDGGDAQSITLTYYGYTGTYNQLQSGGADYSNTAIDISSLSVGKHTIAVWFKSEDTYDSNNSKNYVASFIKPHLISSTDDLDALAISVNNGNDYEGEYFELMNNLNYAGKTTYTPIGTSNRPFKGIFNGKGKTISNINFNDPDKSYVGVFGYVYGSEISQLNVSNCTFTGKQYVGGIVGYNNEGDNNKGGIKSCSNTNVAVSGQNSVGGIAGYSSANITECSHAGTSSVSGTLSKIGGIVGENCGTIEGCFCFATITGVGNANMLGGIAGSLGEGGYIADCIFDGTFTGPSGSSIGGILGKDQSGQASGSPLTRNYYVASDVMGVGSGLGGYDINQNDGAVPSYKYQEIPFTLGKCVNEYTEIGITAYENGLQQGLNYYFSYIQLDDQGDNESILLSYFENDVPIRFKINGRTLYKDGDWNTLCLPFSLSDNDEEFKKGNQPTFSGTVLEGAIVKELESSNLSDDGTLTLNFSKDLTYIEAGYAYLVKWEKPDGYDQNPASFDIKDPTFTDVIPKATKPASSFVGEFDYFFTGCFNPYKLTPGESTELYLGAQNTLYYPAEDSDVTIGAFRGFFQKATQIEAPIRYIKFNFGDESTGIKEITTDSNLSNPSNLSNSYITLDGRRFNGKPATPGLYIINGKKVVIK